GAGARNGVVRRAVALVVRAAAEGRSAGAREHIRRARVRLTLVRGADPTFLHDADVSAYADLSRSAEGRGAGRQERVPHRSVARRVYARVVVASEAGCTARRARRRERRRALGHLAVALVNAPLLYIGLTLRQVPEVRAHSVFAAQPDLGAGRAVVR